MATYADYQAKLKELKVELKKGETGYLRLRIGGEYLVFPHALGLQVLAALDQAEKLASIYNYNEPPRIRRVNSNDLEVVILSREEYEDIHMAQLMQLRLDELTALRQSKGDPVPF